MKELKDRVPKKLHFPKIAGTVPSPQSYRRAFCALMPMLREELRVVFSLATKTSGSSPKANIIWGPTHSSWLITNLKNGTMRNAKARSSGQQAVSSVPQGAHMGLLLLFKTSGMSWVSGEVFWHHFYAWESGSIYLNFFLYNEFTHYTTLFWYGDTSAWKTQWAYNCRALLLPAAL